MKYIVGPLWWYCGLMKVLKIGAAHCAYPRSRAVSGPIGGIRAGLRTRTAYGGHLCFPSADPLFGSCVATYAKSLINFSAAAITETDDVMASAYVRPAMIIIANNHHHSRLPCSFTSWIKQS